MRRSKTLESISILMRWLPAKRVSTLSSFRVWRARDALRDTCYNSINLSTDNIEREPKP
jgi:hypothetical protein